MEKIMMDSFDAYASISRKKSPFGGQPGNFREDAHEVLPDTPWQRRLEPFLGALPRRASLGELGRPGPGDRNQSFAPVASRTHGHPAPVHEGAEGAGQGRLVEHGQRPQIPLTNLARTVKQAQERILGSPQADTAQLLVVEPANSP